MYHIGPSSANAQPMRPADEERALRPTGVRYQGERPSRDENVSFFQRCRDYSRSFWNTCLVCLIVVGEGYDFGVLNGVALIMKKDLGLSTFEISTIIAITPVGLAAGAGVGGMIADVCGRKRGLQTTCAILTFGPIMMAFSSEFWGLLIGRFITGAGIGAGLTIVSIYIAETTPAEMRAKFTLFEEVFLAMGVMVGYLLNYLIVGMENDWRWMLGLGAIVPLIVFLLLFGSCVPESPRWLFLQGRLDESKVVLEYFLFPDEVERAWGRLRDEQEGGSGKTVSWSQLVSSGDPTFWKPFLAAAIVGSVQGAGGYIVLTYYSSMAMAAAGMPFKTAFLATNVMGAMKLVFLIVAFALLDRCGRRPLLLVSSLLTALAFVWIADRKSVV